MARLGNIKLSLNDNDQFLITSTENIDDFGKEIGYKENDILKKINGQVINLEQWREIIQDFQENTVMGEKVKIEVIRTINGKEKTLKLKAKAMTFNYRLPSKLTVQPNASQEAIKIRNLWLSGT